MNGRTGALVGSVLLAAAATFALFAYVRGVERKTLSKAQPVSVFVAGDAISAGTKADEAVRDGLIVTRELPRQAVLDGAVASLDEIGGLVVASDIFEGEQIVRERFTSRAHEPLLNIPSDRQAMSVDLGAPPGVSGFVQTGDRVSVIARGSKADDGGGARVQYVLQDIEVLAVGPRGTQEKDRTSPQDRVLLTLALTPAEAEKLAYALLEGEVYFTLLPPGQGVVRTTGRDGSDLFS